MVVPMAGTFVAVGLIKVNFDDFRVLEHPSVSRLTSKTGSCISERESLESTNCESYKHKLQQLIETCTMLQKQTNI